MSEKTGEIAVRRHDCYSMRLSIYEEGFHQEFILLEKDVQAIIENAYQHNDRVSPVWIQPDSTCFLALRRGFIYVYRTAQRDTHTIVLPMRVFHDVLRCLIDRKSEQWDYDPRTTDPNAEGEEN
jgi:hypothetical protein